MLATSCSMTRRLHHMKHLLKRTLRKLGISIDRRERESYPQFLCPFNVVELSLSKGCLFSVNLKIFNITITYLFMQFISEIIIFKMLILANCWSSWWLQYFKCLAFFVGVYTLWILHKPINRRLKVDICVLTAMKSFNFEIIKIILVYHFHTV